ncbi:hypothetical protein, partial [Janthinobacterium sp. HLX7-2]|uniref:hypothetical protein n=1 Tax=Janthinobacterium sp. HLX7-2 TaxID=1259331 RepID=UPI003F288D56
AGRSSHRMLPPARSVRLPFARPNIESKRLSWQVYKQYFFPTAKPTTNPSCNRPGKKAHLSQVNGRL